MNMDLGYTRLIIEECRKAGLLRNQAANVLSQCHWETGGTMEPVRETFAKTDAEAKARLTKAFKAGKLPWVKRDYWSSGYFGRGFLQITHEENYRKAGRAIGVDLVKEPSKALVPAISAKIAVLGMRDGWFTGKRLSDFITLAHSDFEGARAIVNGDKNKEPKGSKQTIGEIIAGRSAEYDAALKAMGYGEEKPVEPAKPAPAPSPAPVPQSPPAPKPAPKRGILAIIFEIIGKILKGGR